MVEVIDRINAKLTHSDFFFLREVIQGKVLNLRFDSSGTPYVYIYVSVFDDIFLKKFMDEPLKTMEFFYNFLCRKMPEIHSINFKYLKFYSEDKFMI